MVFDVMYFPQIISWFKKCHFCECITCTGTLVLIRSQGGVTSAHAYNMRLYYLRSVTGRKATRKVSFTGKPNKQLIKMCVKNQHMYFATQNTAA